MTLMLSLGPDGALRSVRLNRWGNVETPGGQYGEILFGDGASEERNFGGHTIPSRMLVGWRPGTNRYFEFSGVELLRATYR